MNADRKEVAIREAVCERLLAGGGGLAKVEVVLGEDVDVVGGTFGSTKNFGRSSWARPRLSASASRTSRDHICVL